jgi:5-hydroxyisourate hydrolase-like protein (transthyretin family)
MVLAGLGLTSSAALGSPSDGHVTGVVTGPGGTPIPNVWVSVGHRANGSWALAALTTTQFDGRYDVDVPAGGPHILVFSRSGYATEYYDNATTEASATNLPVTAGVTTVANAELAVAGHVTGTITGIGGIGVPDVDISAWQLVGTDWQRSAATAYTDEDGDYDLSGLSTGDFRLKFERPNGSEYVSEWWDDAWTLESATTVSVTGGATTSGKDAELSADGPAPVVSNTVLPTISGTAQVGASLTATTGTWNPATELSFAYRWLVNGDPVSGATEASYVPVPGDVGKTVRVEVTASRSGYAAGTATSAATAPVLAPDPPVGNAMPPAITGDPRVGTTVTATPGTWDTAGATLIYQWLVAGTPVAFATTSSYQPTPADVGKPLQVRVTATAADHTTGTATSAPLTIGAGTMKATKQPKVAGKAKKNATLKVSPGTWSPTTVTVTYRWYAGAKAIPRATAAKLKLAGKTLKVAAGKAISVVVTVTTPGYDTVTTKVNVPGRLRH